MSNNLRKITPKEVYNQVADCNLLQQAKKVPEGQAFKVMTVGACVTGKKTVTNDLGTSIKFIGQFGAVHGVTGEVFRSSAMFLPGYLEEEIEAMFDASGGFPIEFVLELYIKDDSKNEKNNLGWAYAHSYLGNKREGDPIDRVFGEAGVALPGATEATAIEDQSEASEKEVEANEAQSNTDSAGSSRRGRRNRNTESETA